MATHNEKEENDSQDDASNFGVFQAFPDREARLVFHAVIVLVWVRPSCTQAIGFAARKEF
eukprot:2742095-Rhodomonas_salina.4